MPKAPDTPFHGPALVATLGTASSPCRKPGSDRAFAKSCVAVKRSAGNFSSAFLTTASTFAGVAGPLLRRRHGVARDDLAQDRLRGASSVWRLSDQHLVEHRAESVDVRRGTHVLIARRLLGAHVVRGPEAQTCLGETPASRGPDGQRDAEVRDDGLPSL